ncbi:DUF4232 domain-containing protein [Streptomyces fuscigenes]|uniref:DUF4232 domain-containing protein n=1 Tax=Streptomyces fuscigenes TaxID=1528880 RepID=UPI001F1DD860|nr:DUF4232 domain-containing protein [Streptomyces fuscigenes]MCF3961090.1 DUF4232 domain-containing protein [Streptomyces fuscigenes]
MRTNRKTAVLVAAAALIAAAGAGVAQAAPSGAGAAPSACRPANHLAKITKAPDTAGHHHYRVTLSAPRGYDACTLAGSPGDVRFTRHGSSVGIRAGRTGAQGTRVTFGPGHPVHFDIQVPGKGHAKSADEASFTLRTPGGVIPGTSFAEGRFTVSPGTVVGPVKRGA